MSLDSLADAFYDELCDIYHAEKQLLKALPKMIKKATDEKLVEALTTHLEETKATGRTRRGRIRRHRKKLPRPRSAKRWPG